MSLSPKRILTILIPALQMLIFYAENTYAGPPSEVQISLTPSPNFTTADGSITSKIIGFAQADFAFHDDDMIDHPNGSTIRRARLGIAGTFFNTWGYKLLHDFGNNGNPALQDLFISYKNKNNALIKVGQFKENIGLEWQSAAKYWSFMELPLTAALTPRRAIGASYTHQQSNWRYSIGLFGENTQQNRTDEEGNSLDFHTSYQFTHNKQAHSHVGASLSYRTPNSETNSISIKAKQESATVQSPTINSGAIDSVDSSTIVALEGLWIHGSTLLQAELVQLDIEREGSLDGLSFKSYYLQATYLLTGESRKFNVSKHGFMSVKPNTPYSDTGNGAFEIATRYEYLDTNESTFESGKLEKYVIGLNWYLNQYIRLTADLTSSKSDKNASIPNDDTNTLAFRTQVSF